MTHGSVSVLCGKETHMKDKQDHLGKCVREHVQMHSCIQTKWTYLELMFNSCFLVFVNS